MAGVPLLTPGAVLAAATPATGVRLGMCNYTFRNFTRAEVIVFLKQLGLKTLNAKDVKDHLPSDSAQNESLALSDYQAAGIEVTACGVVSFKVDDDADLRRKFEYAKRAGVNLIVAGDPAKALLPKIERYVKEFDIRFAIHNHGPEDPLWHSPLDVLAAVSGMDARMGCCIDVGHTMRAGVDPVRAIRAAGARLFDVHMKDLARADAKDSQVAVGRGAMPVRDIFKALNEVRYPGYVDLEYEIHAEDPMPGVIESIAYMRGISVGMSSSG